MQSDSKTTVTLAPDASAFLRAGEALASAASIRALLLVPSDVDLARSMADDPWIARCEAREPRPIWVARNDATRDFLTQRDRRCVFLPHRLERLSQIRHGLVTAIARGWLDARDDALCVSGAREGALDMLFSTRPDRDIPVARLFQQKAGGDLGSERDPVPPPILLSVLDLALELGSVRTGKISGTIFTVGDAENILSISDSYPFEPFHFLDKKDRNITDPAVRSAVQKYVRMDGAFIVASDGTLERFVKKINTNERSDQVALSTGTRHAAAGGVTAQSTTYAILVSDSAGDVKLFHGGKLVLELKPR